MKNAITCIACTLMTRRPVSTWEFAAGRYPHWGATLLLLPLVVMGLIWSPTAIWRAFMKGRGELSLYRPELRDAATRLPLDALAERTRVHARGGQVTAAAAFAWLVLQSASVIAAPIAVMAVAVLA